MLRLLDELRPPAVPGLGALVAGQLSHRQTGLWAAQFAVNAGATGCRVPAPPHPAAAQSREATREWRSRMAELRELGHLRERGLLGDAEFDAQKRRLLGS